MPSFSVPAVAPASPFLQFFADFFDSFLQIVSKTHLMVTYTNLDKQNAILYVFL